MIEVNLELCNGCTKCQKACPFAVITVIDKKAQIGDGCTMCGACEQVCPEEAITIERKVRDVDVSKYKGVWVFAEVTDDQQIRNVTFELLTKGGELAMARSLAKELGKYGIRVNTICPDAVLQGSGLWEDDDYRLSTARRYGISEDEIPAHYRERCALKTNILPEDIANAALFLLSESAAKITGAILTVDGGVAYVR